MHLKSLNKQILIGLIITAILLVCQPWRTVLAVEDGPEDPTEEKFFVGYRPSTFKKFIGYTTEYFSWAGGHLSRTVKVYETRPCCKPSGNDMDGCSAPVICPKY